MMVCGNGCPALVARGRCPACRRVTQRIYDRQRGSATSRGYGPDWQAWRRQALIDHELLFCGDRPSAAPQTADSACRAQRRLGRELDHIVPISGPDDPRRFDHSNIQLLCASCHAAKRGRESHESKAKASIL